MKTHIMKILTVVAVTLGITLSAFATGPTIDSLTLQGYAKVTGGNALDAADYRIFVGLTNNNGTSYYWVKEFTSQTISNGLFSLVLTGTGQDLSGGTYTGLSPALPTGMAVDSSTGGTLITKFKAATSGTVKAKVVIYSGSNVGSPAVFTITLNSVPSALVAGGVLDGTITTSSFLAGETVNSSAGVGSAGKIVLLNASGVLADSMFPATLPAVNGSQLTNVAASTATTATTANGVAAGAVGLAGIAAAAKTNSSAGAGDAGKLVLLDGGGLLAGTLFPTTLPAVDGSALTNVSATGVTAGAVGLTGIAAAAKTNSSAGAGDAGKIALLNGSGKIDDTMFPATLPAVDGSALTNVAASTATTASGVAAASIDPTALASDAVTAVKMADASVDLATATVTGILPLANGGTNSNITAANGGAVYSTAAGLAVTAAGTSGQMLKSNGAAAPTWTTANFAASASLISLFEDFIYLPNTLPATGIQLGKAVTFLATGTIAKVAASAGNSGLIQMTSGAASANHSSLLFCQPSGLNDISIATGQTATFEARLNAAVAVATGVNTNTGVLRIGIYNSVAGTPAATTIGSWVDVALTATAATTLTTSANLFTGSGAAVSAGLITANTTAFNSAVKVKITLTAGSALALEINGTPVTITGTPTYTNGNPTCAGISIIKTSAGTSNFNAIVDYMSFTLTSSR